MNRRTKENPQAISLTIFRYIMAETFFAFFISFLFFFLIFFVNQILLMAQEILTKHVPFYQVALLILFSLPSIISMSAPFASLVGTLMTVGRLTSDNEILVMLSSGLSYRNIFLPAITVGIAVAMISFFANDILLPAGTVQFSKLWRRILISTPALEIEPNSVKRFKDTLIVTGNVSGNAIDNLIILDRTNDGERRVIMANNAELIDSGNQGLSLDLNKAFVQSSKEIVRENYDYATADYLQYRVSQDDIIQSVSSISPREMSSRDVRAEIKKRTVDLNNRSNDRRKKVSIQGQALEDILRAGPGMPSWNRKANAAVSFQREMQALASMKKDSGFLIYVIEYYKKFSLPLGAFSFVFLSVSLGLMAKKSGQTVGFIFGNIIAAIYWSMFFIGQTMGLRLGTPPFWSMWLPNILALSVGVLLAVIRIRK
jgi:lipopolysaccharide export system permease protein